MLFSKFLRKGLLPVLAILIAVSAGRGTVSRADDSTPPLPDRGLAPELTNTVWLNTDKPIHLADLRGQVVLLDFWTVYCINCFHTLPYLKDVYARLGSKGLQVIGIHFPEYNYEHDIQVVKDYMKEQGITYPVAIDNDGATWDAYQNHWWPAMELIDKNGHRRFVKVGEGDYATTEAAITALLAENYTAATPFATLDATMPASVAPTVALTAAPNVDATLAATIAP